MERTLEVTFEHRDGAWQLRFRDSERGDSGPYPWEPPTNQRDLFRSLVRRAPEDLVRTPARMRIAVVPDDERPPGVVNWAHMVEPRDVVHLHQRGWTLSQRTSGLPNRRVSRTLAIHGSDAFYGTFRRLFPVATVRVSSAEDVPQETIVIVERLDAATARAWQEPLYEKGCPLVIWCREGPLRAHGDLTEIVRTSHQDGQRAEPDLRWLMRLVPRLRHGVDPEIALRDACLRGDDGASFRWWLRGAPHGARWEVDGYDSTAHQEHRNWHIRLDRSAQEQARKELVERLLAPGHPDRRVAVILSSGPPEAQVDLFLQRPPPPLDRDAHPHFEFDWGELPGAMVQRLCRELGAQNIQRAAERLAQHDTARGCTAERPSLLWVRPHVIHWEAATPDGERLTAEHLRKVLDDLKTLADALRRHGHVRVLVDIGIHGATRAALREFRRGHEQDGTLRSEVLPELRASIPEDDLLAFLDRIGAGSDARPAEDVVEELKRLPYDELVNELWTRYSDKLGPG